MAARPQGEITDADLQRVGVSRMVAVGAVATDRSVMRVPLEVYVARVLAGEAERNAPEAELQALAIAIRTYATFNAGRHGRDGFDLCDTTHCQVMRTATPATRQAAFATAGQILTWQGGPAEIFYSASCGGRSESASAVWPGANLPYLRSVQDDVHEADAPWTYTMTLRDVQRLLARRGFAGDRLRDVRIASRTASGRVATLRLSGLEPDAIAGDQFRLLVGASQIRSTAFSIERQGDRLAFTGRGYGHGVGMCVIGAGRRARRGETVRQILAQYYPGLEVTSLELIPPHDRPETLLAGTAASPDLGRNAPTRTEAVRQPAVTPSAPAGSIPPPPTMASPAARTAAGAPVVLRGARTTTSELQETATLAYVALTSVLGATAAPLTIDVHETVESFRQATGKPWWVSASVNPAGVDLAPPPLLVQRDGIETTLRVAIAQAIMTPVLNGRPEWVRIGGARYFARATPPAADGGKVKCPADAELTLAISAAAQREAESRAERCFARALAATHDWRQVR